MLYRKNGILLLPKLCTLLVFFVAVKVATSFDSLDCGMRRLFLYAARKAVPWRDDMSDVYEALELRSICNETNSTTIGPSSEKLSERSHQHKESPNHNSKVFYVCPSSGDDSFRGNHTHPFLTIQRALAAARDASTNVTETDRDENNESNIVRRTIVLLKGIHYLNETIVLTPEDSYLTIRTDPDERAWISGGILINSTTTSWEPVSNQSRNIFVANLSSLLSLNDGAISSSFTGLFTINPHQRMTLARFPNANVEEWNSPDRYVPAKVVDEWLFPPFGEVPQFYFLDLSHPDNPTGHVKNDSDLSSYNMYGTGVGGVCSTVWGDSPSYWCSNVSAGGWAEVDQAAALAGRLNIPRGLTLYGNDTESKEMIERIKRWGDPRGAIIHVSHTQGWSWHMFNVSRVKKNCCYATLEFASGGSQGGRNWQCKDSEGQLSDCDGDDKKLFGGDWYIEGILEELDEPGEFFFDKETKLLFFYPEKTKSSIQEEGINVKKGNQFDLLRIKRRRKLSICKDCQVVPDLIATKLQTLIRLNGTSERPVKGVRLLGLGFRDAAKTYMEQWSAPSGGDWALHRGGAVHIEGAENVTISDCKFNRLDGNAIMLAGYCRHAHIRRSEFSWIGNGAIATWGDTEGYDATAGTQPRFSLIEQNVMSNLGLYQKQSSGWGQSKACQNIIRSNVMFNLPRAAINFNDGLGGGNLVDRNVIFNTCRESGDHGPINSWDRMPFLTNANGFGPSFQPLPTHTTQNLILANYGASQGFDNDDGSSYYATHGNVFYSADGFKMDYGGHDSAFFDNLVYGEQCFGTGSFIKGHADKFYNNTCIAVNNANNIGRLWQCSVDGMNPTNNTYFTSDGNATWTCGDEDFTLPEMQKKGFELGSVIGATPDVETIISWARAILFA